jgi:hypothetical protein
VLCENIWSVSHPILIAESPIVFTGAKAIVFGIAIIILALFLNIYHGIVVHRQMEIMQRNLDRVSEDNKHLSEQLLDISKQLLEKSGYLKPSQSDERSESHGD